MLAIPRQNAQPNQMLQAEFICNILHRLAIWRN